MGCYWEMDYTPSMRMIEVHCVLGQQPWGRRGELERGKSAENKDLERQWLIP